LNKLKFIIADLSVLLALSSSAQDNPDSMLCGTYGSYADQSTYTELKLNCDSTFEFIDCFELGSPLKYSGTWMLVRNKVILIGSSDHSSSKLPKRWKKQKEGLISAKTPSNKFRLKGRIYLPKSISQVSDVRHWNE
jgi:hypothetical protein